VWVLPAGRESISRATEELRAGGIVAFPTETVYGLGALALNPSAVARIFEVKRRPHFDPLIVHVLDDAMLRAVVAEFPERAEALARRFWPGPLTLVLQKSPAVPGVVTAGLPTVAVRMPSHPVARALLQAAGAPIAAPSANRFGQLSPTRAEHVAAAIHGGIAGILDGGPTPLGIESTVIALEPRPELLRPGALEAEAIESAIGPLARGSGEAARSPGMLARHYSPQTPLRVVEPSSVPVGERADCGVLALWERFDGYAAMRLLSARGDLHEAAARFFEALHELDAMQLQRIDAQPLPENGLGLAMMDRLRRAAARRNE
jgi:L-threonylcarbamoyladenylate synthase